MVAVAEDDGPRARAEIDRYDRENPAAAPAGGVSPPLAWGFAAAAVYAVVLLVFRTRGISTSGKAHAGLIREGEWWRTITALTLHSDIPHIAGNLVFGSIFGVMLAESVGFGVAWLGFVVTGAVGNGLNALIQSPAHTAVGASTGVFGMLGMQVAHDALRRREVHVSRMRRWAPFAVGAGLLAWLGGGQAGERIDVGAHVLGFAAGLAVGAALGSVRGSIPRTPAVQGAIGTVAIALVALAWSQAR